MKIIKLITGMNQKIQIPNLNSTIKHVEEEYASVTKWLKEVIEYDVDEYVIKEKYYRLLRVILNDLEVWERNLFIGSHFAGLSGNELGKLFNIKRQSVYNYMAKINNKIKEALK